MKAQGSIILSTARFNYRLFLSRLHRFRRVTYLCILMRINYALNETIKNRQAVWWGGSPNEEGRTLGCLKINVGEIQLGKRKGGNLKPRRFMCAHTIEDISGILQSQTHLLQTQQALHHKEMQSSPNQERLKGKYFCACACKETKRQKTHACHMDSVSSCSIHGESNRTISLHKLCPMDGIMECSHKNGIYSLMQNVSEFGKCSMNK